MSNDALQLAKTSVNVGDLLAGKYRVERILGAGAMGVVVAARHTDLHELRALKFMLPSALGDAEGVERFLREARAAARLKSQHVAHVHDVGRLDNGAPYIVMEYLEGRDLKSLLEERGRLSAAESSRYLLEVCHALGEAHAAGIVHRDLKPANIYLSRGTGGATVVKVLDFGIAKISEGSGAGEMTSTSALLGTPLFMSPEQMRSTRNVDLRTDIWALGVILYRMLSGRLPFFGDNITEICTAVVADEPEPVENIVPDLPRGFGAIVARCLMKNPAGRFSSIAELAGAIEPYSRELQPANPSAGTHVMNHSAMPAAISQQSSPQQPHPQQTYSQQPNPQQGYPQQSYPQQSYPQQGYPQQSYFQASAAIPSTIQSTVGTYTAQPSPARNSNAGAIVAVIFLGLLFFGGIGAGVWLFYRSGNGATQTASTGVKKEELGQGNVAPRNADTNAAGQTATSAPIAETALTAPAKTGVSTAKTATTTSAAPAVTGTDLPVGGACAKSDQCKSGFCVDRVCCDSACSDKCMACTVGKKGSGGKDGYCGFISGGRDPDRECGGGVKRCDGFGGCVSLTPEQIQSLGGK